MSGGWDVFADPPEVAPADDDRPHVRGLACWCCPFDDDGVLVHRSADQRELFECGTTNGS